VANLKKDPQVQAIVAEAVAKAIGKIKVDAAKIVKRMAAEHGADAKNANNRDAAKRLATYAADAAQAIKDMAV
jgi:hypothetical protein